MELYSKYKKFIFMVAIVLFAFSSLNDAMAFNVSSELRGIVKGKPWVIRSAILRKEINSKLPKLVLELSDVAQLENKTCNETQDINKIKVEIPIKPAGGFVSMLPDYENSAIFLGQDAQSLACYYSLNLESNELNENGLAYVSGNLKLSSTREDTELVGSFKARVCD